MDTRRLPLQMFFAKLPDKRKRGGQQLSYARRVRQEIKLAYEASTPEIQEEIGDCDDHVNWVRYAGMFASDEEKDNSDSDGATSYRITTFNQTLERCDIGNK